ncbi:MULTISPECIES: hypothetical protein [Paraburkholderia]|jgi:hypothetical protein|uniref:hypothetical protein n=1 Tax=Paraburkholderia TaxID=1822464 RepID=UPI00142D36F1|nr:MULTISPECIES: hypothetical protein [Paraburkholderia]MBK3837881.1 hypothetical protein [Paraburkholderia aspalathi]
MPRENRPPAEHALFKASGKLREESVTVELAEKYFTIAIVAALRHTFFGAESVMSLP